MKSLNRAHDSLKNAIKRISGFQNPLILIQHITTVTLLKQYWQLAGPDFKVSNTRSLALDVL